MLPYSWALLYKYVVHSTAGCFVQSALTAKRDFTLLFFREFWPRGVWFSNFHCGNPRGISTVFDGNLLDASSLTVLQDAGASGY